MMLEPLPIDHYPSDECITAASAPRMDVSALSRASCLHGLRCQRVFVFLAGAPSRWTIFQI
jgi:hypothetical protein